MGNTVKALVVPADDTAGVRVERLTLDGGEAELRVLQQLVGGYVETSTQAVEPDTRLVFLFNADGKAARPNLRATTVWHVACEHAGTAPLPGDYLGGDVVILGSTATGSFADVPRDWATCTLAFSARRARAAAAEPQHRYTVIGFWLGDQPVICGVVAGQHDVGGGDDELMRDRFGTEFAGFFAVYVDDDKPTQEQLHGAFGG